MNNQEFGNKNETQEKERSFVKGLGIFILALFLAVMTVVIINI